MSQSGTQKSRYHNVELPDVNLISFLFRNVDKFPDCIAYVEDDTGREITYKEFRASVKLLSQSLKSRGVKHSDVVCIYADERIDWVITAFAVASIGAIFTGCNKGYQQGELLTHIELTESSYVFCSPDLTQNAKTVAEKYGKFKELFIYGTEPTEGFTSFNELLRESDDRDVNTDALVSPDDVISICFSSGTTGTPKGIMLTHRSLVNNVCMSCCNEDITRAPRTDSVFLNEMLFLHSGGQEFTLTLPFYAGAKVVIINMYSNMEYKFQRFVQAIEKYKVTSVVTLPHIGTLLSKHPLVEKTDLSSLRSLDLCGSPIGKELHKQVADRVPRHTHVGQVYGMSELLLNTWTPLSEPVRFGSVGIIVPNVIFKVIDVDTGAVITTAGKSGELLIKTPAVFKGYLNRPDLTSQVLDDDGFYHSGDIGYFDADGFLYILDRVKDVMFYNGSCIWPSDLEDLIRKHPDIADVGVIGVHRPPDDLPRAYVQRKPNTHLTEDDVVKLVDDNVAQERRLRGGVKFVDSIPRAPGSGKIMRRLLKDMAEKEDK